MAKRQGYIAIENMQPRIDEEGRKRCLNCDAVIPPRNRKYCSPNCSREFYTAHNWPPLRLKTIRDSKYTCGKCGFHFKRTTKKSRFGNYTLSIYVAYTKEGVERKDTEPCQHPETYFVVDHIIPIFAGGPEFDPANLQVLCKPCDKMKTARDLSDYHSQRKIEAAEEVLKHVGRISDWIS